MTELSGETCAMCGEPIAEGDVVYRPATTIKVLDPDGTEQPGNPLDIGMATLCSKCAAKHDESKLTHYRGGNLTTTVHQA